MEIETDTERLVIEFMAMEINANKFHEMLNHNKSRIVLNLDDLRKFNSTFVIFIKS